MGSMITNDNMSLEVRNRDLPDNLIDPLVASWSLKGRHTQHGTSFLRCCPNTLLFDEQTTWHSAVTDGSPKPDG